MKRVLVLAIALAAIALSAGTAPAQGKKYETPQAVFDAAKAAAAKKDFKTAITCFTDDTTDGLTGAMVFTGALAKAFAKFDKTGKADEMVKELNKIFDKYGITDEALKNMPKPGKDPEAMPKAFRALGKTVKNKSGFLEDMMKLMDTQGKGKDSLFDTTATLKDVTVSGDSAKGTVSGKKGNQPINFKKIDGGWKIDLPLDLGKKTGPLPVGSLELRQRDRIAALRHDAVPVVAVARRE